MRWHLTAILMSWALFMGGCSSLEITKPAAENLSQAELYPKAYTDVPLPSGFIYVPDKSFRHHTNFEAARLTYERDHALGNLDKLVSFFEQELPKKGWEIKFIYGLKTRRVIAEKADQRCEIVLARRFRENRTLLIVRREKLKSADPL